MRKLVILPVLLTSVAVGMFARVQAQTATYTTSITSWSFDSYGNPKQVSFTISPTPSKYQVCLEMTTPVHNSTGDYATKTYSSYAPCKTFTSGSSHRFGTSFTFGGGGTYAVHWYVPDKTGTEVTTLGTNTFDWKNKNAAAGVFSPCPPDPQLQIGVWRPSRHQILNRCQTNTGKDVSSSGSSHSTMDHDRIWKIAYGSSSRQVEFVARDWYYSNFLPLPSYGRSYTLTGVYICDLYHGHKEFHPVFSVTDNSTGATSYSGPQYSTKTPSVSGTWSLHSCG